VDAISIVALVVALAVAVWQWRVVNELRAIRHELERTRWDDDAGA
jgi:HAMP domain-containing protein